MQTKGRWLGLILGVWGGISWGDVCYQDFDALPLGPISNQAGWVAFANPNTLPGSVAGTHFYSPPHALELPVPTGGPVSSAMAIYTNFNVCYTGVGNPILRFSACLARRQTNGWQDVAVAIGELTNWHLMVVTDTGPGYLRVQHDETAEVQPQVAFTNGRFARVTLYYNMSNNTLAVDYDGTRVVRWTNAGATVSTRFNAFLCGRFYKAAAQEEYVAVDDLAVETFPDTTWAWWRFEEDTNQTVRDQLGRVAASNTKFVAVWEPGWTDGYFDGLTDAPNRHALRRPVAVQMSLLQDTPAFSNWTFEAIFRLDDGKNNAALLDWNLPWGFNTTSSWIGVFWHAGTTSLWVNLRDSQTDSSAYEQSAGLADLPADRQWHHVALVKSSTQLRTYVDYRFRSERLLTEPSDGVYHFTTQSLVCIGESANGGNTCQTNHLFDEIRFSTGALTPPEFLQPSRPLLIRVPNPVLTPAPGPYEATTISGRTYTVWSSDNAALWTGETNRAAFKAEGVFSSFSVPAPTSRVFYLRMRRE